MSYPHCLASLALGSWLLLACGGSFESDGDGAAGSGGQAGGTSKGGSGASAGAGRGGAAGGGGGDSCEYNGAVYEDGEMFSAGDGCNACSCEDGAVGCTAIACPEPGCFAGGTFHSVGDSWDEGCNTCSCEAPGQWSCTLVECRECSDIETAYAEAVDDAKTCNPELSGQCSQLIFQGLQCGCESFVNPENVDAVAAADSLRQDYLALSCGGDVLCGACLPPSSSYCSADGRCVDVWEFGAGDACKVGGVVYPSGSSDVPDPFSCNTCECVDGQLVCTEINCPVECPPNSVPSSQCVQCGPADGCEVVEHACLPVCTDTCEIGACVGGSCKTLCG